MEKPARWWDGRRWDAVWLLVVGAATSVVIVLGSARLSATFDEPTYIEKGLECWRTGSYKSLMRLGAMPLSVDAQTLPLYLMERYRGEPFDVQAEFPKLLGWARLGTLVFWWLLLFYGMRVGRALAGPWGGRLSVTLLALEPTLAAHAGLVTADLAVSAMLVMYGYYFAQGRELGWKRRILLPAILGAGTMLTKASGLVFCPLVVLAIETSRLLLLPWPRTTTWRAWAGEWWERYAPLRRDATWIAAISMALTFFYVGSDWKPEVTFVKAAESLPPGRGRDMALSLATNAAFFTNAGEGLVQQIKHNFRGHGTYLFDQTWRRSVWYYFPTVLSMKVTVSVLAMLVVTLLVRGRAFMQWPALAALALFLFSVNARVQIGVRLVLPLVALGIIATAIAFVRLARESRPRWQPLWMMMGLVLVLGSGWSTARSWPNGLTYVNELWGNPRDGYRLVSDSNFDWGQELVELDEWTRAKEGESVAVWYFGTDPAARQAPFQFAPLHTMEGLTPATLAERVPADYLAVGTTILHGSYLPGHPMVAYLRSQEPIDRTTTFLIYKLPRERMAGAAGSSAH